MKSAPVFLVEIALVLTTALAAAEAPPQVSLRAPDGSRIALWQKAASPNKPYIAQLFAPGEKPVPLLDDSPPDHFHHHGLMLALGADTTDFWAEKDADNIGRQEVVESVAAAAGDGFTQKLRWLATDGTPLLDEARRVSVRVTGKDADIVPEVRSADMLSAGGKATFCRPRSLRTTCPPAVSVQNARAPYRTHVTHRSTPRARAGFWC